MCRVSISYVHVVTQRNVMPRKQDPIWLKFTRSALGKSYKATFKACQYVMLVHVERMKVHMATCKAVQNECETDTPENPDTNNSVPHSCPGTLTSTRTVEDSRQPKKRQCVMSGFITKPTASEKEQFDRALAKMIYTTNSSFKLVEHLTVVEFVNLPHPGYKPASRYGGIMPRTVEWRDTVYVIRWLVQCLQITNCLCGCNKLYRCYICY